MKKSMLKQSVIALMVGAAVSGVSVAADTDPLATATGALKDAIKSEVKSELQAKADETKAEQDKKINDIKTVLVGALNGKGDQPGILGTLADVSNLADSNKAALETKADKAALDTKADKAALDTKADKAALDTKADKAALDTKADKAALDTKADKAALDTKADKAALDTKADQALADELDEGLGKLEDKVSDLEGKVSAIVDQAANKEDLGELNNAVVKLQEDTNELTGILSENSEDIAANKEAIDINKKDIEILKKSDQYRDLIKVKDLVENKADKEALVSVNADVEKNTQSIRENKASIKAKAGKDYVDQELAKKADSAYVTAKLNQKVDQSTLDAYNNSLVTAIGKKADQTDVDANKAAIGDLATVIDEAVKNVEEGITANKADIETNADKIADNASKIAENRKDINKNALRIQDTRNKQFLQNTRLDKHGERITAVEEGLTTKADQDYVEGLERDVKINTQDIKDLSVGIRDHVLPAIEANRSDIDKNASRITDTRNKQALQNARLDNHNDRIEANKAAIGDLATATDKAVKNLGDAVRDLDEDLAGTQDAVAENRKDIDKNASRITDTRNKQVLQNARLDNHGRRIDANKDAISTNAGKITANEGKITANEGRIAAHNQRLDHLDNRVNKLDKDLKRGLAAQAALTGLFQPYTVGKVNFTAAVGGYKSQTAVAIGTGYRYNQNIATKAGVAFTQGGGVTYNAGVNFEW